MFFRKKEKLLDFEKSDNSVTTSGGGAVGMKQKIFPGYNFTYILTDDNKVKACGYNSSYYCCGQGAATGSFMNPLEVRIPGDDVIQTVANGISYHKLLLSRKGVVYGVGYNANYGMGDGGTSYYQTAKELTFFRGKKVAKVHTSYLSSYVILKNGDMYVFGYNSSYYKLGNGSTSDVRTPHKVTAIKGKVKSVAGGTYHSFAVTQQGEVWVCGQGTYGATGMGSTSNSMYWTKNNFFQGKRIKDVACGYGNYSFFLTRDGKVYACGYNSCGILGNGNTSSTSVTTPQLVNGLHNIVKISCGNYFACFLAKDGKIYVQGSSGNYQTGTGSYSHVYTPRVLSFQYGKAVDVVCGIKTTYVTNNKGEVYCVGGSSYGECLCGRTGNKTSFTKTNVTVKLERALGSGDYRDYMKLIKTKVGNLGKSARKKKQFFTIKFKNKKDELTIPVTVASFLSPTFGSMIEKGKLKMKMEEEDFAPMARIFEWNKSEGKDIAFKSSKELISVYLTARKWKVTDLVYGICKSLEKETDMKKIIDLLFELDERRDNNNSLFLAAKIAFKKNYQTIITTCIGYLVQKKTEKTTTLYTYLLSAIITTPLEKLDEHKDFVASDSSSGDGQSAKKRSKLFDESFKDIALECSDGKFIVAHKEIISRNSYFNSLIKTQRATTLLKIEIPSRILLFIIVCIYNEPFDDMDLNDLLLQELVELKFTLKKFGGVEKLKKFVAKLIETYDYQYVSKEELSKSVLNLQEQMTMLTKKFKDMEEMLLSGGGGATTEVDEGPTIISGSTDTSYGLATTYMDGGT